MLEVGSEAPDFLVNDHNGNRVTLKDLRGKRAIETKGQCGFVYRVYETLQKKKRLQQKLAKQ